METQVHLDHLVRQDSRVPLEILDLLEVQALQEHQGLLDLPDLAALSVPLALLDLLDHKGHREIMDSQVLLVGLGLQEQLD